MLLRSASRCASACRWKYRDMGCAAAQVIVFTASLAKYADPLLDLLDKGREVRWRLFREACCPFEGNYVKDLHCLGRPLADSIIVDNSPHSCAPGPVRMPLVTDMVSCEAALAGRQPNEVFV